MSLTAERSAGTRILKGAFPTFARSVTQHLVGLRDTRLADIDGDGDDDALVVASGMNTIGWFKNLDGKGGFEDFQIIASGEYWNIEPHDMDNDGDIDIIARSPNGVVWYENLNGQGAFSRSQLISQSRAFRAGIADLDDDGNPDVAIVTASGHVEWFANENGTGSFGEARPIGFVSDMPRFARFPNLQLTDMDADGDEDVAFWFSVDIDGSTEREWTVGWIENRDRATAFSDPKIVYKKQDNRIHRRRPAYGYRRRCGRGSDPGKIAWKTVRTNRARKPGRWSGVRVISIPARETNIASNRGSESSPAGHG